MAASDVSDGPVLSLINKRLRALRKKFNRIVQMEEAIAQGKPINKEQEEVLRSKPAVSVLIDELEKLRQPLSAAVDEEVNLAVQNHHQVLPSTQPISSSSSDGSPDKDHQGESQPNGPSSEPVISRESDHKETVVEDLLNLLYFGSLFDVKSQSDFTSTMLTRTHERGCCLTYDYVTDDATDLLGERDLDLISKLGGLLISRPVDSSLSHKNALQRCLEHAKLWLAKSDQLIEPSANITYAELRERLSKIMASDYLTTTPEMKAPVEVAAAAGNYASFQVPVQGSISSIQVEASVSQFQQDEGLSDFQEHEMGGNQSSHVEEFHKDDEQEMGNSEEIPVEREQNIPDTEVEYNQIEFELKEQQYVQRRPYQNQRGGRGGGGGGGGRRGYPNSRGARGSSRGGGPYQNGRGGGPYQNGRNQYYEQQQQPGGYPRNYYNNRGGRGGRGGLSYNNHGSVVQGGQASASVGVGS
ncbi:uncharacterized protein LOC133823138 [Humulus lupulus]|uniref:uncharacterized protein LOC133823138 n=1 Tax=Humulus lupulus TaxID=3486 RepID=UPI002B4044DA|nr:uncharacterized protein LOC133823138 [Humulus lupulus]